jgi:hypothetical protein
MIAQVAMRTARTMVLRVNQKAKLPVSNDTKIMAFIEDVPKGFGEHTRPRVFPAGGPPDGFLGTRQMIPASRRNPHAGRVCYPEIIPEPTYLASIHDHPHS